MFTIREDSSGERLKAIYLSQTWFWEGHGFSRAVWNHKNAGFSP